MAAVKIDHSRLSPQALNGVIEEFVTRDGTDYGEQEVLESTKVAQIKSQLEAGKAVIVFDPKSETCNILKYDDPALNRMEENS